MKIKRIKKVTIYVFSLKDKLKKFLKSNILEYKTKVSLIELALKGIQLNIDMTRVKPQLTNLKFKNLN